jgi:hypothetical protein
MRTLLLLLGLYSPPVMAAAESVPMPASVVLIVCKTEIAGAPAPDQNAERTHVENRRWATENAMMVCRRQEVQMYDQAVDQGADPQPFNDQPCMRSGMLLGSLWDAQHPSSAYRFWRVACPTPIVRQNADGSENIIAWKMPECGHRDILVCEVDTEI